MTSSAHNTSRRNLVKGAAWATPAVLATAAVPAYAASTPVECKTNMFAVGGREIDFGETKSWFGDLTTTYNSLEYGYQVYFNQLPAGVTVERITLRVMQEARRDNTPGPGFFAPSHRTSDKRSNVSAMPFNPPAGSGWVPTVQNTTSGTSHRFVNGETLNAWDMIFTWEAARNTTQTYSGSSVPGCMNFTTGSSDAFKIRWDGVPRMNNTTDARKKSTSEFSVTAYLSNGETLTYQSSTAVYKG